MYNRVNISNQITPIVAYGKSTRPQPLPQTIIEQLTLQVAEIERALIASAGRIATARKLMEEGPGDPGFEDKREELAQQAQRQSPSGVLFAPISDDACAFQLKRDWTKALSDYGKHISQAEQIMFSFKSYAKQRDDLLAKARAFPTAEQEAELRATLERLMKPEDAE